jgi:hypothetical protein
LKSKPLYALFEKQLARKDAKPEAEEKEKADLEATLEKENADLEATLEKGRADLEAALEKEKAGLALAQTRSQRNLRPAQRGAAREHGRPDTRTRGGKRRTEGPDGGDGDGGPCGGIRWRSECRGTGLPASKKQQHSS